MWSTQPRLQLSKRIKQRVEEFYEQYGEWPKTILMENTALSPPESPVKDVQTITPMYVKTAESCWTYALGGPNFLTEANVNRIHTRPMNTTPAADRQNRIGDVF